MGSSPRLPLRGILWVASLLLFAGAVTFALFSQTSANVGNTYSASSDWKAPTVDRAVIQRSGGPDASAGYLKQGQSYYVYASVSDTGNPASGVSSVTANVCNVTSTSCGSVAMSSGSYTVNSLSYNYRSTSTLTASNPLSEGSKSYSITAADNNSNSATNNSFSVGVDNTNPTASDVACGGNGCTTTGFVGAGKTYYIYSQVTDSTSGVDTVTTDPRNLTASASATTAMSASGGPWTIGGTSYNYRSIQLTADAGLTGGSSYNYTVTASDNVTNSTTPTSSATDDNTAPAAGTPVIAKTPGYSKGSIRASGSYFVYADPNDAASGVDTQNVTADVDIDAGNTVTTGKHSVPMCYSAGGYSVQGTTYHYKSDDDGSRCTGGFGALTADSGLTNGNDQTFNVAVKDNAANSATASNTVHVDNVSGSGDNVAIKNNSGGTTGKLEQSDTVEFTFGDTVDPESILSGWDGTGNSTGNVVVRLTDGGGSCVASSDQLQVWDAANTTQTNLGTVCLGGTSYNTSGSTITFGATGTASSMVQGCLTACTTVTLGTPSATAATQGGNTTAVWTPSASAYDQAGNAYLTTPVSKTIDNTVPTISATRICGGASCSADYVGQGKTYYIYANASDATSPTLTITADVSNITTGASSVTLTSCASGCTVNGTTYAYKSTQQTANGTLSGTKSWTLTVKDGVLNQSTTTPTATVDNTAPTVGSSTIAKSSGTGLYLSGRIKASGTYYVYANASDTGGSGVDTVTANVCNITSASCSSVTFTAGSYSVNGTSYGYRSAALTADSGLADASTKSYTVTAADNAVNSSGAQSFNVTIDNTVPFASTTTKISATNKAGGTSGLPELGDTITYTYSEQIDPESILAGWTAASTNVVVRLNNNIACPGSANANDNVTIFNYPGNSTQVNLGCIDLASTAYVTANRTFGASGSATLSTMVQSGSAITITLGTASGSATKVTTTMNMVWWPSSSAFDAAGNAETTTSQAETDADKDF